MTGEVEVPASKAAKPSSANSHNHKNIKNNKKVETTPVNKSVMKKQ